jgi:hypothetical protein
MNMDILIDGVAKKIRSVGITVDEVRESIGFCENTNQKTFDEYAKTYTGYRRIANVTAWIEYAKTEKDILVRNVYAIRSEPTKDQAPAKTTDLQRLPYFRSLADMQLHCCRHAGAAMEPRIVVFRYLHVAYKSAALICPICGLPYISKDIALHMQEAEKKLESK